jgi:hypothetical protein
MNKSLILIGITSTALKSRLLGRVGLHLLIATLQHFTICRVGFLLSLFFL